MASYRRNDIRWDHQLSGKPVEGTHLTASLINTITSQGLRQVLHIGSQSCAEGRYCTQEVSHVQRVEVKQALVNQGRIESKRTAILSSLTIQYTLYRQQCSPSPKCPFIPPIIYSLYTKGQNPSDIFKEVWEKVRYLLCPCTKTEYISLVCITLKLLCDRCFTHVSSFLFS